jgi:two-component system, OmpR family, sensor histidine kinase ChvG
MQVFNNLVANAVSFSPVGGQVVVTAEVDAKADAVEVTVDDDGPGIAEELRERIFERFYSQRSGSEPRGGHSGLGLSIVRQIVEAFDGTVVAENRRDATGGIAGARFRVRLPLHPAVDRPRRTGEAFQHDADPRQLHSS